METLAEKKVHFAPYARQVHAMKELVESGEVRSVTDLMRLALDHYLAARGRPPLAEQARLMAEDFERGRSTTGDGEFLQAPSMATDEDW